VSNTKTPPSASAQPVFWTHAQQLEKLPPCQAQCPNSGDVRGWLGIIAQHEKTGLTLEQAYDRAWEKLTELNPLPATLGRICPHPCEDLCSRRDKDGSVSINAMERYIGDWGLARSLKWSVPAQSEKPESIGVIGSGPASLSFTYQMARRGYQVSLYERHAVAGGMLRQAIPDFRLPREVLDAEIQRLFELPVTLHKNTEVGLDISLNELRDRHALIFLGLGAQGAHRLGIPGEAGPGVVSGIAYLRRRKQRLALTTGRRVVVIGGGNTAIDAARCARREGAEVTVLYRRSAKEMPAATNEVDDARAEGVRFEFLVSPTQVLRKGPVIQWIEVQAMRLGAPDEQGRRRPVPIPGEKRLLRVDTVIVAVSQAPDWAGLDLEQDDTQWLMTEEDGRLAENLWAGGDDRGPAIAGKAIAQGRLAAEAAHAELSGTRRPLECQERRTLNMGEIKPDFYRDQERECQARRPQEEWLDSAEPEIDQTIGHEQAQREAARCMSCGLCFDCEACFMYCNGGGFTRLEESRPGHYFALSLDACEGCGKCIEVCPCGYLEVRESSANGSDQ
jgi:formate dehydrogenase major subunit